METTKLRSLTIKELSEVAKKLNIQENLSFIEPLNPLNIKDIMENCIKMEVPTKVEYKTKNNWGDAK